MTKAQHTKPSNTIIVFINTHPAPYHAIVTRATVASSHPVRNEAWLSGVFSCVHVRKKKEKRRKKQDAPPSFSSYMPPSHDSCYIVSARSRNKNKKKEQRQQQAEQERRYYLSEAFSRTSFISRREPAADEGHDTF